MKLPIPFFILLFISSLALSCSSSKGRKTLVFDPDGRSMRYENGRPESRNKKWNSSKSPEQRRKKRDKAFRKRKRY